MPRPKLTSFSDEWEGDAVADLVYQTLCDRGLAPEDAARKMAHHYLYEPFGRMVDEIQDAPEDWQ